MTPKTIQIFLPGGDPQGILIAQITIGIVQVTKCRVVCYLTF